MILTNVTNLPAPIVAAINNDEHISQGSDIGASTVGAPVKQVALRKLHAAEITEDAADRIWALLGQAVHVVLERAAKDQGDERRKLDDAITIMESFVPGHAHHVDYDCSDDVCEALDALKRLRDSYEPQPQPYRSFAEERWEMTVLGWRVAARCDHLTLDGAGTLTDYKVTSAWSVKDGAKDDWIAQLNVTRLIAYRAKGYDPKRLQVTAILRDWRKNEALSYGDDYPQQQIATVPVPLWSLDKTQAYLEERVRLHQTAQNGGPMPDCTAEERWERPTTYAVMRAQNKKATRVYETRKLADEHAATQSDLRVVVRPGSSPRCQQYCSALPFCAQGQALTAAGPS